MNVRGNDNRSVRFTRVRIRTAFFEIMQSKNVQKITVTEVVRQSGISRATFYLHYSDIFDLLGQIEEDIIAQVLGEIKKFDEDSYVVGEFPIAKRVFEVFDAHADEMELLFGENGDPGFREKFQSAMSSYFKSLLSFIVPESDNLDNVLVFLVSGVLNMFLYNIKAEHPVDMNTLAMIANRYLRATNKLIGLPELEAD